MTPEDLIAFRRRWGLTQRDFGRMLGVANVTICRWEKMKRPPRWLKLWIKGWVTQSKEAAGDCVD